MRIGTSGFAYRDWVGSFYPRETRSEDLLAVYSRILPAVEIDQGLERLPSDATVAGWVHEVPEQFRFVLKAPRRLMVELRHRSEHACRDALLRLVRLLGVHAGPVLVQLPGDMRLDVRALERMLGALAPLWVAVEARHPSWRSEACLRVLSTHGAALVHGDRDGVSRMEVTADFVYWRFRRPREDFPWAEWSERCALLAARKVQVYAFLRADRAGQAPARAMMLAREVEEQLARLRGNGQQVWREHGEEPRPHGV